MANYFSRERGLQRWERIRKAGRSSYIVKYGVLGWGIPVAILTTLMDWLQGTPVTELAVALAIRLPLFAIGGIAFGAFLWAFQERSRARALARLNAGE
jgi:hypothetical protein